MSGASLWIAGEGRRTGGWMLAVLTVLAGAGLLVQPFATPPPSGAAPVAKPAPKPGDLATGNVVVTVRSIDELWPAARLLVRQAGLAADFAPIEKLLTDLGIENGAASIGLEPRSPTGVHLHYPVLDGDEFHWVAVLPVKDRKLLLDAVAKAGLQAGDPKADLTTIVVPEGPGWHVRFVGAHAFLTDDVQRLQGELPDPKLLRPDVRGLVTAVAKLDRFGEAWKDSLSTAALNIAEAILVDAAGKADVDVLFARSTASMIKSFATSVVSETRDLSAALDVDVRNQRVTLEVAAVAIPNSRTAAAFQSFRNTGDVLGPLPPDSAAALGLRLPVPTDIEKAIRKLVDENVPASIAATKDAGQKRMKQRLYDSLLAGLRTDLLEAGVRLRGPSSDGVMTLMFGMRVKDAAKLDKLFRDTVKDLQGAGLNTSGLLKIDADKIGAVNLHTLHIPENPVAGLSRLCGSSDATLMMHRDVVVLAFGKHGAAAVKDVVTRLSKPAPGTTESVVADVVPSKLVPLIRDTLPAGVAARILKPLEGVPSGQDRVRLTVSGGTALRVRLEGPTGLLSAITGKPPEALPAVRAAGAK